MAVIPPSFTTSVNPEQQQQRQQSVEVEGSSVVSGLTSVSGTGAIRKKRGKGKGKGRRVREVVIAEPMEPTDETAREFMRVDKRTFIEGEIAFELLFLIS